VLFHLLRCFFLSILRGLGLPVIFHIPVAAVIIIYTAVVLRRSWCDRLIHVKTCAASISFSRRLRPLTQWLSSVKRKALGKIPVCFMLRVSFVQLGPSSQCHAINISSLTWPSQQHASALGRFGVDSLRPSDFPTF